MVRLAAAQIYAVARAAGFDRDAATTMTAIALAESGGRDTAHATVGEDSRGLWQINAAAHPDLARRFDLYDPLQNAQAAVLVSGSGRDISPWTTAHDGSHASYLRYREIAQAAAVAYGEPGATGWWGGVGGYGDHHSAFPGLDGGGLGLDGGGHAPAEVPASAAAAPQLGQVTAGFLPLSAVSGGARDGASGAAVLVPAAETRGAVEPDVKSFQVAAATLPDASGNASAIGPAPYSAAPTGAANSAAPAGAAAMPASADAGHPPAVSAVEQFVENALAQSGDRYVYGAVANVNDPRPSAFDCSELVHWAAARSGIPVTDGAAQQYLQLQQAGLAVGVDEAIGHRGALLFSFSSPPRPGAPLPAHAHVAISLGDGRTIEARGAAYGVGSFAAGPGRFQYAALLPGDEESVHDVLASAGVLPGSAGDPAGGGVDGPVAPGGAGGPAAPGASGVLIDSDRDGLSDDLERRLGLDPFSQDTDHDGLSDSFEVLFSEGHFVTTDPSAAGPGQADRAAATDQALDAAVHPVELQLSRDGWVWNAMGDHTASMHPEHDPPAAGDPATGPTGGPGAGHAVQSPVPEGQLTVVPLLDGPDGPHPFGSPAHPALDAGHGEPAHHVDVGGHGHG